MKNSNLLQKVQYIKSVYPETFDKMSKREVKGKIFLAFGKQEVDRDAKNNSLYKAIKRCKNNNLAKDIISNHLQVTFCPEAKEILEQANHWKSLPRFVQKFLLLLIK